MKPENFFQEVHNNFQDIIYSGLVVDSEIKFDQMAESIDKDDHEALIMRLYFIALDPEKDIKYFINQYDEGKYLYFLKLEEGNWLFILSENQSFAKIHFFIQFLISDSPLELEEETEQPTEQEEKINSARRIQELLLPSIGLLNKDFKRCELIYSPQDMVGGDFYWTKSLKKATWIILGDCTGHSMEGALASVSVMSIINQIFKPDLSPHLIIKKIHQSLKDIQLQQPELGYGIGCEMMVMRIDHDKKELAYSGTGFPLYKWSKQGNLRMYRTKSASVAPEKVVKYIRTRRMKLNAGDNLFSHSDGITDQLSEKGRTLSRRGLIRALCEHGAIEEDHIKRVIKKHQGDAPQTDDMVGLILEIK